MRIEKVVFVGTPEEFETVRDGFFTTPNGEANALPAGDEADTALELETEQATQDGKSEPAKDVVVAALTRINLTKSQKAVLGALVKGAASGITTVELASATGLDRGSIKAVLRSFGKRVAHTPGWPKGVGMFDQTWEGDKNRYRLPPAVREVLEDGSVKL